MSSSNAPDSNLLKSVLDPLLEDFQYWFTKSLNALEVDTSGTLGHSEKERLEQRLKTALQEVMAVQMLSSAIDSQAGIDASVVLGWHQLVQECWAMAMRLRQNTQTNPSQ